jgi:hypothetical protein
MRLIPRLMAIQPICFARPRESPLQRQVNQPEIVSDRNSPPANSSPAGGQRMRSGKLPLTCSSHPTFGQNIG